MAQRGDGGESPFLTFTAEFQSRAGEGGLLPIVELPGLALAVLGAEATPQQARARANGGRICASSRDRVANSAHRRPQQPFGTPWTCRYYFTRQVAGALTHLGIVPSAASVARGGSGSSGRCINADEALVVVQLLAAAAAPEGDGLQNSSLGGSLGGGRGSSLGGGGSVGALKPGLSQRRAAYSTTGRLDTDPAVVAYMARLDAHRKTCEVGAHWVTACGC